LYYKPAFRQKSDRRDFALLFEIEYRVKPLEPTKRHAKPMHLLDRRAWVAKTFSLSVNPFDVQALACFCNSPERSTLNSKRRPKRDKNEIKTGVGVEMEQ